MCSRRFERRDIVSGKKSAKSWAIREVIYVNEKSVGPSRLPSTECLITPCSKMIFFYKCSQ